MPLSKVSFHLVDEPDINEIERLAKLVQPAAILSLGSTGYMAALYDRLYAYLPNTVFIQRSWWGGAGDPDHWEIVQSLSTTLLENGTWYYDPGRAYTLVRDAIGVNEINKIRHRPNMYMMLFCESGNNVEYWQFERERAVQMWHEFGIGALVGNTCTGCSDEATFNMMDEVGSRFWAHQVPVIYGEHGYAPLSLKFGHGDFQLPLDPAKTLLDYIKQNFIYPANMLGTWLAFRIFRSRQQMIRIGIGDVYALNSEMGYDNLFKDWYIQYPPKREARGWKDWAEFWEQNNLIQHGEDALDYMARDMEYANNQFGVDEYVVGGTWFSLGYNRANGDWFQFDTLGSGIWERYAKRLNEKPTEPPPPNDEEPPTGCAIPGLNWVLRAVGARK